MRVVAGSSECACPTSSGYTPPRRNSARSSPMNTCVSRHARNRSLSSTAVRAAAQGVFQAMRQQAMRGSRLRPPGLCLPPAHPRHRGTRANAGHRAPAGHAPMRTGGGRPGGAGGISRPFLGLADPLQIDPSTHKDHLLKVILVLQCTGKTYLYISEHYKHVRFTTFIYLTLLELGRVLA